LGEGLGYAAFISYSHVDEELTQSLQRGLERLSKPWYKRGPFIRVFRDETSLASGSDLEQLVIAALDDSGHMVLLLSPDSAQSEWVDHEVAAWLSKKPPTTVIPVVTEWNGPGAAAAVAGAAAAKDEPVNLSDFDSGSRPT
jgi:hypothetical protein